MIGANVQDSSWVDEDLRSISSSSESDSTESDDQIDEELDVMKRLNIDEWHKIMKFTKSKDVKQIPNVWGKIIQVGESDFYIISGMDD